MCFRTIFSFSCGHSEEVVTKCRDPYSSIIPKRCLATFKLPETKPVEGNCTSCSIKVWNAIHEAKKKRIQERFELVAKAAKADRAAQAKVDQGTANEHVESSLRRTNEKSLEEVRRSPLAELE